jgi:hypothetical protein
MMALAIAASANAPLGLADTFPDGKLGVGKVNFAPTDVFGLTCPNGTASVRARGTNPDGSGADEISVQVINPNGAVKTAISLEGVSPPTAVLLVGGAGHYLVSVHKDSSAVVVPYSIVLDCYNASVPPVPFPGNQSTLIQNQ